MVRIEGLLKRRDDIRVLSRYSTRLPKSTRLKGVSEWGGGGGFRMEDLL